MLSYAGRGASLPHERIVEALEDAGQPEGEEEEKR
jgi:hypothetical protein